MDDESGFHHVCVTVGYNKLNPFWVDKNLVQFYAFAVNMIGFHGF